MAYPKVEDLMKIKCPGEAPHICLPYGSCCKPDEYCSPQSRACESCFPAHLLNIPTDLLLWCKNIGQYNSSDLQDASCGLACHARFNSLVLSDTGNDFTTRCNGTEDWSKPNVTSIFANFTTLWQIPSLILCIFILFCIVYHWWKKNKLPNYVGQEHELQSVCDSEKKPGQMVINMESLENNEQNIGEVAKKDLKLEENKSTPKSTTALRASPYRVNTELEGEPLLEQEEERSENINDRNETSIPSSNNGHDSLIQNPASSTSESSRYSSIARESPNNSDGEFPEHPAVEEQKTQRKLHFNTTVPDDHNKTEIVTNQSTYKPKTDGLEPTQN